MGKAQLLFDDRVTGIRPYLRAMRVHQWLKNLLVLVPLFLSHRFYDPLLLAQAMLAFLAFSFCASSVYLLNDLLDLPADRRHPTKRHRPFAAGELQIQTGVALMAGLLIAAVLIGLFLPPGFLGLLAIYYVMTLGYSFRFKQAALVDVLVLAGLYTLRILSGSAAIGVETSFWLLAFSMFFFLSLALVKRYSEMLMMHGEGREGFVSAGRGYGPGDLETLSQLGTASGYLAVLVLALYISSDDVRTLYTHPEAIWLLCPLLLYWISRLWLMARRDEMHEDPVVFAIEDRRSHLLALMGLAAIWAAL
jgi:4-hydroxybenzoate polyprenyltransferase